MKTCLALDPHSPWEKGQAICWPLVSGRKPGRDKKVATGGLGHGFARFTPESKPLATSCPRLLTAVGVLPLRRAHLLLRVRRIPRRGRREREAHQWIEHASGKPGGQWRHPSQWFKGRANNTRSGRSLFQDRSMQRRRPSNHGLSISPAWFQRCPCYSNCIVPVYV